MRFTIRRAEIGDLPALLALESLFPGDRLRRRHFRYLLTRAQADVWVATDGSTVLGNAVALYRRRARRARLYSLVVTPDARRYGVAGALLRAVENAAAARAVQSVHLEVRCDNGAAIGLYRKLGYVEVGRLPRFYEDGQDALCFERRLTPAMPPGTVNLAA